MNTEDQEKIYKLYESDFRGIQSTQPGLNLLTGPDFDLQHPNNSLSTPEFLGLTGRAKHDRLTPEQEESESKFKYKEKRSGDVYYLVKVEGGNNVQLVSRKQPDKQIIISLKELAEDFKEI